MAANRVANAARSVRHGASATTGGLTEANASRFAATVGASPASTRCATAATSAV
jgi:hypothetical protein